MEKQQQITLARVQKLIDELQKQFWLDQRPLTAAMFECPDPIPYAEAIQREFAPVELEAAWGSAWCTAWFHLTGSYPAEWAGSTVAVLIDTESEGLVWQHGEPAQGLDEHRHDFILTMDAQGADDVRSVY